MEKIGHLKDNKRNPNDVTNLNPLLNLVFKIVNSFFQMVLKLEEVMAVKIVEDQYIYFSKSPFKNSRAR